MTVVSVSFFKRCKGKLLAENVYAGNNNGQVISVRKGILKSIKIADKEVVDLEVLVIEDDMFNMEDSQGNYFEADMLMGYDIISKFKWIYSPTKHTLDISDSDMTMKDDFVYYKVFPIINIMLDGQIYISGIDTGHTETMLGKAVKVEDCNLTHIEDEIVGIGSIQKRSVLMIPKINVEFEGTEVELYNITVQEKIYGAPKEMDILLGMDFLEKNAWEMDFSAGVFRFKE